MPRGRSRAPCRGQGDEAAGDVRATAGERARERPARIRLLETELEAHHEVDPRLGSFPECRETLTTRLASSMAESLGVSLGGVATGAGALGQRGVEAAGKAAKGAGSAVQRLFGGRKKR